MDEIVLRPAQPGDGDDLARGWIETGQYYAALDPQAYQLPEAEGLAAWFETLLGKPRSEETVWLVAEAAGRVVGSVEARHCCIEPEDTGEAQRSGGPPHPKAAKKDSNHSIVAMVCQV